VQKAGVKVKEFKMFEIRRASERGHVNHGWLDTHHTFSFASYMDPQHMGFRVLRVLNEDRVAPGQGFGAHPHKNMEIITYVLAGALAHEDSLGNGSVIRAGEFQAMSAGRGVTHSELNASQTEWTHFYQIWIVPNEMNIEPRYQQRSFESAVSESGVTLVASPSGEAGSPQIHQDAKLYLMALSPGEKRSFPIAPGRYGWFQLTRGRVTVGNQNLIAGDGLALSDENELRIVGEEPSAALLFELP